MDRSTFGSPAKYTFCFGENEEESPFAPYHVRNGFDANESVVTVMSAEPNHNLNDHGSTSGKGLLTTFAGAIASPAANTVYGKGPYFIILGPEHAATLARDNWTIQHDPASSCTRRRASRSSRSPTRTTASTRNPATSRRTVSTGPRRRRTTSMSRSPAAPASTPPGCRASAARRRFPSG